MNALEPIISALLGLPEVTDIVGKRVNPVVAPQRGELPDIIVNTLGSSDEILLCGPGEYPEGRVRLEIRARRVTDTFRLGDKVIKGLNGLSGTFSGMRVDAFIKLDLDTSDASEDHSTFRRIIDFSVRYRAE